jgi:hypothetical protein
MTKMITGPFFSCSATTVAIVKTRVLAERDCPLEHGCDCFIADRLDKVAVASSAETEHQC